MEVSGVKSVEGVWRDGWTSEGKKAGLKRESRSIDAASRGGVGGRAGKKWSEEQDVIENSRAGDAMTFYQGGGIRHNRTASVHVVVRSGGF